MRCFINTIPVSYTHLDVYKRQDVHLQKMHRIEHEADLRRHEIMTVLAKDSRPPMDREDIVALSNALDDLSLIHI